MLWGGPRVPAMCPPFVRHVPALLCPLVACCGAGVASYRTIARPTAFILHVRWSVVFICSFWLTKFGLRKRTLRLKNCLGSTLV